MARNVELFFSKERRADNRGYRSYHYDLDTLRALEKAEYVRFACGQWITDYTRPEIGEAIHYINQGETANAV